MGSIRSHRGKPVNSVSVQPIDSDGISEVGSASDNSNHPPAYYSHRAAYTSMLLDGDLSDYRHSDPVTYQKNEDHIDPFPASSSAQTNSTLPQKFDHYPSIPPYSEESERYHVFRSWKWEFLGLCLAFGLMAAIFTLLGVFQGKAVPDWGTAINLSALLALLATILRANLVVIVGRIISQAKWDWFSNQKPRPLRHLQDFDSGSRSALGSARLIRTANKDNLVASISAALMIFSLAIGPFVQQAIKTTGCAHPIDGVVATLPYAHYVPAMGTYDNFPYPYGAARIEQDTNVAILISLTRQQSQSSQIQPVCSTGNCTFPNGNPIDDTTFKANGSGQSTFSTIGLCTKCVDVSSLVKLIFTTGGSHNGTRDDAYARTYGLPNHLNISYQAYGTFLEVQTDLDLNWTGTALPSEMKVNSRWAFANVSILTFSQVGCEQVSSWTPECPVGNIDRLDDSDNPNGRAGIVAITCIVYPCIRKFVPTITNNVLEEYQLESTPVFPDLFESQASDASSLNANSNAGSGTSNFHYVGIQTPCKVKDTIYTAQNISAAQNATKLRVYQPGDDGTFRVQNTTAPEECIFRHNAVFGSYLATQFQDEIFTGDCSATPQNGDVSCSSNGADRTFGKWMELVYNEGNATMATISSFLDSFAMMMTNEYRVSLGTSSFNPHDYIDTEIPRELPTGLVDGLVWSTTICTSMKWEWLLLPSLLVILTGCLFFLAVYRSWNRRYIEPVFKDSILPLLYYRQRFQTERDPTFSALNPETDLGTTPNNLDKSSMKLMEVSQLKEIATAVSARFRWNGLRDDEAQNQDFGTSTGHTSSPLQWTSTRRKTAVEKLETDSLLNVDL